MRPLAILLLMSACVGPEASPPAGDPSASVFGAATVPPVVPSPEAIALPAHLPPVALRPPTVQVPGCKASASVALEPAGARRLTEVQSLTATVSVSRSCAVEQVTVELIGPRGNVFEVRNTKTWGAAATTFTFPVAGSAIALRGLSGPWQLRAFTDGIAVSTKSFEARPMKTYALLAVLAASSAFAVSDVTQPSALATDGAVRLRWSNPIGSAGVMILRATSPVSASPVDGVTYAADDLLGNATVAYAGGPGITTHLDSDRTNGTKVHYRIFSRNGLGDWSAGHAPTSSGLDATPRAPTGSNPRWCTALGTSAVMQPVVDPGVGVYFAGNGGTVNAALTHAGHADDGDERWRPIVLDGNVQGRFPVVTLYGRSTKAIVTGDSSGRGYAYDASTGALIWAAIGGIPMGDAILAQPGVQLRAYANAAYAAAYPATDLVFFATRNASATSNKVVAIEGATGAEAWIYAPGDLDVINGGLFIDYTGNRLWVASRSNGGSQQSLRVLDALTGAKIAGFSLGDLDTGVVRNPSSNQALVVNTAGVVTGLDLDGLTVAFQQNVGAATSWPFPVGTGFIVSLASGAVERWTPSGRMWTTPIANPTGVNLEYSAQVAYVGSTDGTLHQLSLATGADQLQLDLGDDGVGTPSIDVASGRIHVGTLGGHVCAIPIPQ